ncbi:acetate kinase [Microbulbifer sp. 2205BS26-8]|uniref:acetate kinase n=1 Tax=Microbulbifer sp. 2205BS26-8 TaxID=3064386 RepID=UPI00273D16C6|nr:acetate kinase [Microbulbifer sp. 2205BS26-8]MDP5208292.1 acetate kinase [Microbulbifer sp. 2205BS26-8]
MLDPDLVLILNCGSSSLKFAVLDPESGKEFLCGQANALGGTTAKLVWRYRTQNETQQLARDDDYTTVIRILVDRFDRQWSELRERLLAIGHRVVHGGELFASSVLIDEEVLSAIRSCCELAPLHNPVALEGIQAALAAFPQVSQVAVFDTAFHQSMPDYAYLYALPYRLYQQHHIRRYGMHGSSHRYISERTAQLLGKPVPEINVISAHLGNGASIAAIKGGHSVDTSMGLTPLEGLVMGTRCGDLDPGLLLYLGRTLNYSLDEIEQLLNWESGMTGLSELSNDCRALEQAAEGGHTGARLALEVFCYRLAKYIAAYTIPLHQVTALVFTGGIGENSAWVRTRTTDWLNGHAYQLDPALNEKIRFGAEGRISRQNTPEVLVIPTREEWVIARDAAQLVRGAA